MPWRRNCWPWVFENPDIVIARLYREQDTIAVLLWKALRKQFPVEDRPTALKHLRRLLTGKPDAKAVEELRDIASHIEPQLEAARPDAASDDETSDTRARDLLALATLFHRCGQGKLTAKYLALHRHRRLRPDFDRRGQFVRGGEAVERSRQVLRSGLDQGSPQRDGLVSAGLGTNQARRGGRGPQADGTGPDGSRWATAKAATTWCRRSFVCIRTRKRPGSGSGCCALRRCTIGRSYRS